LVFGCLADQVEEHCVPLSGSASIPKVK
jgi:hypothetical protein